MQRLTDAWDEVALPGFRAAALDCRSGFRAMIRQRGPVRTVTRDHTISLGELRDLAGHRFGDMVKAVVDLGRDVMLVDADMHADQEAALLDDGARQVDLWGINLYPDLPEADWIEFDSMINLRPSFGNRSRGVDDSRQRERIVSLVNTLVRR